MKAAILGTGRMGTAITWAMKELGFDVVCVDADHTAGDRLNLLLGNHNFVFYRTNHLMDDIHEIFGLEEPDVVISSLPYDQLLEPAKYCISQEYRYCDLGGRVDVSKDINEFAAKHATVPVMTDLGLAPGWVNILTEEGCRKVVNATDVSMMVGGLPDYLQSTKNILRYFPTWSVAGLINEYRDDCQVLEDGEIRIARGLEGHDRHIETQHLGALEAFYTSGGASHTLKSMQDRGVQNCSYRTLRYPGHRDMVKFLIRKCKLDDATLKRIFVKGTHTDDPTYDCVIMISEVKNSDTGLSWSREILVKSDHLQHISSFTAMQKATAFPIASVASLMAGGKMEGDKDQRRDYYTQYPKSLTYKDIPTELFNDNLKKLNIL